MNYSLSPLYQKALAVLILFFVVFAGINLIIQPLYEIFDEKNHDVTQLEERLFRYQQIISSELIYKSHLKDIAKIQLPDLFYHGSSIAVLNAEIQGDLRRLISREKASIENIQSIKLTPKDGAQRIGVRMVLQTNMASLVKILKSLKNHHRLLNLDNISFRTSEYQGQGAVPQINVRWDVVGFGVVTPPSEGPEL